MGLTGFLARRAVRATRVLVVAAPDTFAIRVAAERKIAARGWRLASSPADADVLLQVGRVFGELGEVAGRLWDALPGPRARVAAEVAGAVPAALDEAVALLLDAALQADDAASRGAPDVGGDDGGMDMDEDSGDDAMDHGSMDHEDTDDEDMDHEDMDHGDMDHGDMDHEGMDHSGMDHGGMDMDMDMSPDGIPLAEGSEDDRDGLEMDVLPVRLGPVLPDWPAGLVLDVTLHGDVIMDASARWIGTGDDPGPEPPEPDEFEEAGRACDEVVTLLSLGGWPDGAARARAARDAVLDARRLDAFQMVGDLRHRIMRSGMLRWSLRRTAVIDPERAARLGLPPDFAGDCYDRLLALVDRALSLVERTDGVHVSPVGLDVLGHLVLGLDLAAARLLVASLGAPLGEGVRQHA